MVGIEQCIAAWWAMLALAFVFIAVGLASIPFVIKSTLKARRRHRLLQEEPN